MIKPQPATPAPAKSSLFTFVPKSGILPTMEEYKALHGMVCGISSAKRCIASFDGCTLFAPTTHYEDATRSIVTYDFNRTVPHFSVWSYYGLVLLSLTGFCSLIGKTKLLHCEEEENVMISSSITKNETRNGDDKSTGQETVVTAKSFDKLQLPSKIVDYMLQCSMELSSSSSQQKQQQHEKEEEIPQLMLQKRFEFQFGSYLDVVMFHFVCSNGYKYLVEIYDCRLSFINITRTVLDTIFKMFVPSSKM